LTLRASLPCIASPLVCQDIEAGHQSQWFESSMAIVQLLLEARANVGLKDAEGRTALDLAKENKASTIVKLLQKESAKERWGLVRMSPRGCARSQPTTTTHLTCPPSVAMQLDRALPSLPSSTPRWLAPRPRSLPVRPVRAHPAPSPRASERAPRAVGSLLGAARGMSNNDSDRKTNSDRSSRKSKGDSGRWGSSKNLIADAEGAPATSHEDIDVAAEKPPGGGCRCVLL